MSGIFHVHWIVNLWAAMHAIFFWTWDWGFPIALVLTAVSHPKNSLFNRMTLDFNEMRWYHHLYSCVCIYFCQPAMHQHYILCMSLTIPLLETTSFIIIISNRAYIYNTHCFAKVSSTFISARGEFSFKKE